MLFTTPISLLAFLPLVLAGALSLGFVDRLRGGGHALANLWLFVCSLLFYFWGEQWLVLWMLASIGANWGLGLAIDRARASGRSSRPWITLGVVLNLGLLGWFKYANFFVGDLIEHRLERDARRGPLEPDQEVTGQVGAQRDVREVDVR